MANYTVVPFVAAIDAVQGSAEAAAQLEKLIQHYSSHGWEYVRLESVETFVAGNEGCFGLGVTPSRLTSYSMAVFRQ